MGKLIHASALLAALLFGSLAQAQTLWRDTNYGMSIDQVRAAIPEVADAVKPGELAGGAKGLLTIPKVQIAGADYQARFFFLNDKLVQVMLSLDNPGKFDSSLRTFETLEELLRVKYGREIKREVKRGVVNQASATWMAGGTNISVLTYSFDNDNASLNINYQVRVAKEADKL